MTNMTETHHGRLIGASLGPGDPGLITRRAWAVLSTPARWIDPVRQPQEDSYALEILRRAGVTIPQDAEPLPFPMTRNPQLLAKDWAHAASRSVELLSEGHDLVFPVEGDASTYATFGHLARAVRELVPEIEVEVVPGVSSFAAAAARVGEPLANEDDTLAVLPASYGVDVIDRPLDELDTLVLLKVKPMLDEALARAGATHADVAAVASIDLKADEPGLEELAAAQGWHILFEPATRLASVTVPNPSQTVRRYTGTASVAEAAALLASGVPGSPGTGRLLLEKHRVRGPDGHHATVSVARMRT